RGRRLDRNRARFHRARFRRHRAAYGRPAWRALGAKGAGAGAGESTMIDFVDLWVYLAGEPLLWLTATLVAYVIADWVSLRFTRHPAANPVLLSVVLVSGGLAATGA